MTDEKKPSKEGTRTVETERSRPPGRLVSGAARVAWLFFRTMKIVIVGKDRPFFRPEVVELIATIRRRFYHHDAEAAAPRRLTLCDIERLAEDEFDALPETEKQRFFRYMDRENFPSVWQFYEYQKEPDSHVELADGESATATVLPMMTPAKDSLPEHVAKALEEVLSYLWQDEIENFIADEPAAHEPHIFRELVTVDGWFYGYRASAEELVRDFYSEPDRDTVRRRVQSFRGN
jgi:hypothetical protein